MGMPGLKFGTDSAPASQRRGWWFALLLWRKCLNKGSAIETAENAQSDFPSKVVCAARRSSGSQALHSLLRAPHARARRSPQTSESRVINLRSVSTLKGRFDLQASALPTRLIPYRESRCRPNLPNRNLALA